MRTASSPFIFATVLALAQLVGCGTASNESTDQSTYEQNELAACGLDDVKGEKDAHLRACAADEVKKTTICHVPPGNPANAHTICVGNPSVKHHLSNHDDYLGPCKVEAPCPPPPPAPETPPAPPAPEAVETPPAPQPPAPAVGGASGSTGSGGAGGEYVIPPPG